MFYSQVMLKGKLILINCAKVLEIKITFAMINWVNHLRVNFKDKLLVPLIADMANVVRFLAFKFMPGTVYWDNFVISDSFFSIGKTMLALKKFLLPDIGMEEVEITEV